MPPRSPRRAKACTMPDVPPIVQLWLLRLLVPLGGYKEFASRNFCPNDVLAEVVGLGDLVADDSNEFEPAVVRKRLRTLHAESEQKLRDAAVPACLGNNIARLSRLVGLSDIDSQVLAFAVLIHAERLLDDTGDFVGQLTTIKLIYALSVLLDLPEPEVRQALNPNGILTKSGLLSVDRSGTSTLRGKLNLLSNDFADHIYSSDADPVCLLRDTVKPCAAPLLELDDYKHIDEYLVVLRPFLKLAVTGGRQGVNVFLHGDPGTGKSQLAKVLAKELGCELFEVASEDSDGDPVAGDRRLRAFRAAQSFLAHRHALILFDEVEDVFNDGNRFFGRKSTAQTRKAWINRSLEENAVPTLWLSNSIDGLDPAFIRRFDMVFELPVPPKKQRERIIAEACSDMLDAASVARIAESESLAPAVVTKAASVVSSIRGEIGDAAAAEAIELLIGSTLKAQGHKPIGRSDPSRLPEIYDPIFVNADADLTQLASGLVQSKSGRLCLYGPPGTGKTAFGRWLAEQLGAPLLVKRASDILSPWVGQDEKNIARAFKQAEQEGALLLIDEVDSFLQDRRGAQRSWEVTLVNEMLTQMESFSGVFIASTNLMAGLDQAALRRFDLKVKFDFLKPEQASELLSRHCTEMSIPTPKTEEEARMRRLTKLTPGDFAAVVRQNRFRSISSADALVSALEAECAVKEGANASIGFLR